MSCFSSPSLGLHHLDSHQNPVLWHQKVTCEEMSWRPLLCLASALPEGVRVVCRGSSEVLRGAAASTEDPLSLREIPRDLLASGRGRDGWVESDGSYAWLGLCSNRVNSRKEGMSVYCAYMPTAWGRTWPPHGGFVHTKGGHQGAQVTANLGASFPLLDP